MKKFFLFLFLIYLAEAHQRIQLRDVTSVTLKRGEYTTGRRSSPVPQLQCVGGTASGKFSPKVVQCYNRGFDGVDVQWECKAEMPDQYEFGQITVSCEGYDHPNDPFVLAGSCGLEYELDYSRKGTSGEYYKASEPENKCLTACFYVALGLIILYIIYTWAKQNEGLNHRGDGFGSDYPGGGGGGGPDPPGWRPPPSAPPSYDEATKRPFRSSGSSSASTNDSLGFYTGMGLGALGGYAAGAYMNSGTGSTRRRTAQFERDTGNYQDDYDRPGTSTGSSSGTHTSSSFGGTRRR